VNDTRTIFNMDSGTSTLRASAREPDRLLISVAEGWTVLSYPAARSEVIALRDKLTEWIGDEGLRCPDCTCTCGACEKTCAKAGTTDTEANRA
jgi:hypothetical protein